MQRLHPAIRSPTERMRVRGIPGGCARSILGHWESTPDCSVPHWKQEGTKGKFSHPLVEFEESNGQLALVCGIRDVYVGQHRRIAAKVAASLETLTDVKEGIYHANQYPALAGPPVVFQLLLVFE